MRLLAFLATLAALAAQGATVTTAKFGDLGMDANVVTNVDLSGFSMAEEDPYFIAFKQNGGTMYGPLKLHQPTLGGIDMSVNITSNGVSGWKFNPQGSPGMGFWTSFSFDWADVLTGESDPNVPAWAKASTKPSYSWSEIADKPSGLDNAVPSSRKVNNKPLSADITLSASDVNAASATDLQSLEATVNTWETYWDGDEVCVTVTNYDSSVNLPSLYLEQKIENTNAYRLVWSEKTRWESNAVEMAEMRSDIDSKADRAWGYYDSHTGNYAPDGYTWISSPRIAVAGGLAYQRTLTSNGAIWVLVSNGLVAETGGDTNGFFRITDDTGATTFEITRGDKRTVGATAAGIKVSSSGGTCTVSIPYNVTSDSSPTLYGTASLSSPEWTTLSPQWLGQSGAWTAVVTTASSQYFFKGEYETGGETYIRNVAPISAESGIYCTDGVHKVRPVYNNGAITWEVVQ